ncbi:type I restriction enzyme R subunit [Azospirillum baldaniorum]|uniref:type I restriction-modification system endonuclease n=1 Tax=Azospirillum baldaniorum TaxID=1064539 RepID=UPI00119FB38C|nr:type I restriction-modification system endonuclease [Azospirillum baldaniorum]TWA69755.1 type I restriction enzyme R subunit [Azospirillum baldaniorum]
MSITSANFAFLATKAPQLARLATQAERNFADDPNVCLFKMRQFGEVLAQLVAAKTGTWTSPTEAQMDLLRRLQDQKVLTPEVADYFHRLRKVGNQAVHDLRNDQRDALTALKIARQLGLWFYRTLTRDLKFNPGPFVPPSAPPDPTEELRAELARLQADLDASRDAVTQHQAALQAEAERRLTAEERAARAEHERQELEALARAVEADQQRLQAEMQAAQATTLATGTKAIAEVIEQAQEAAAFVDLDERETRRLIDTKLIQAGWEADSERLTHAKGVRPQKGRNLAIAEWPTGNGPADYVLFVGMVPVAVVEAKRQHKNVSAAVDQAERYSKGFHAGNEMAAPGGPWGAFQVPFLFATNGRRFHRQFLIGSGIWFRDARQPTNLARPLEDWPSPEGLAAELARDTAAADAELQQASFDFAFGLRDYQVKAIRSVEEAIAAGQRDILLAMATGTGKTKTCIALVYRLLAAKRFRRILFLVDRNALGEQAAGAFKETRITSAQAFADIFGIKELKETDTDSDTKVQIATVQAMVRRIVNRDDDAGAPPVDQFDCVVVDECHRGYLLDQEMGEEELAFRDMDDYVSKYRQVLDRFDAVRVGLTATPALHTTQIFGSPVFQYTYREAVVDGWLVDHDTPLSPRTRLKEEGIGWTAGEDVEVLDTGTGAIDTVTLPDELKYEVEGFNRRVITREFNRVVAEWLAEKIDPSLPGKTLVFAATDMHADIVVDELKKAFQTRYGAVDNDAVKKITRSADRPLELIRRYKNEQLPSVAVTVDLLTTGIDVPEIVNLVFIRRVNSRILYEQMIGRATRPCDRIGKTSFRIYDAVGIYAAMQRVTAMKPVVADANISFAKLAGELTALFPEPAKPSFGGFGEEEQAPYETPPPATPAPAPAPAPQEASNDAKARYLLDQFLAKLQRRRRGFSAEARRRFHDALGQSPEQFAATLNQAAPAEAAGLLARHPDLIDILDGRGPIRSGDPTLLPISQHADEYLGEDEGYGPGISRPEDYLSAFETFVRENLNAIPALTVIAQRPRDLTRQQLKELSLALEKAHFREADLKTAWARRTNQEIAASIVGFIRRAALGDPLLPYERRVDEALARIQARHAFNPVQKQWLQRIAAQLKTSIVVDRQALDAEPFRQDGGFKRLNRIFDDKLEDLLGEIGDEIWSRAG